MPALVQDLPTDIIHELFLAVAVVSKPQYYTGSRSSQSDLGWIKLTHVCAHWRLVGITLSALWADVITVFPKSLSTVLERSKDRPLRLNLHDALRAHEKRMVQLLPRGHDIRASTWAYCKALAGLSLPHLVTLAVSDTSPQLQRAAFELRKLAAFNAPSLIICNMNGVFLPFSAPRLLVLCIDSHLLNSMQLVNVLKTCPQLIKLVIMNGLQAPSGGHHDGIDELSEIDDAYIADMVQYVMEGMHSDGKPTDPPPINLSRLRYAEFSGYGPYVYLVLRRLQTPSNAIFDIEYPNDPEGIRDVMSGLRIQLASLPVLNLTAIDEWPHGVELYFTKVLAMPEGTRYAGRAGVSLKTLIKPEHTPEILSAHPTPSAVQTLAFIGHDDMSVFWDPRGLLRPLRRYSSVTTIYAQENAGGLFKALAEDLGELEDFIFPGLQNIIVHHPEEHYPLGGGWWQELVEYLCARKAAGCAVRRLTIKGNLCHLSGGRGEGDQELTLESERELVKEIVDERDGVCRCSKEH